MEVVRAFNTELSSLYESRPPISKAKMTQITKSAIKGIKFYKHIVQSVEKFVQKCRPEYKVPGLYVIDSIVRQSRHQFGQDKDVFGPRFVKNIGPTFQHLFKCSNDDRSRIIRVLNLWQKNNVFPIDIIQPLMDMGNPNTATSEHENPSSHNQKHKESDNTDWKNWPQDNEEPLPDNQVYAEMSTKNLEKFTKAEMTLALEREESSRTAMLRNQQKAEKVPEETVKFNKKLLDFDYGDEEDEDDTKNDDNQGPLYPTALALSMAQKLLTNPELLRQLQQFSSLPQQSMHQNEAQSCEMNKSEEKDSFSENAESPHESAPSQMYELDLPPSLPPNEADTDDRMLHQPPLPPQDLDERSLASIIPPHRVLPPLPYSEGDSMPYQNNIVFPLHQPPLPHVEPSMPTEGGAYPLSMPHEHIMLPPDEDERAMYNMPGEPPLPPQDYDERNAAPKEDRERSSRRERSRSRSTDKTRGRSSRRRSRSKSPGRKRSRSRSHSRRSSTRTRERERIREKEKEREKERERKRKGLPPVKKDCISVCSRTIWMGHVPKSCGEDDIKKEFEQYGTVCSVDIIPPRGCAYILMTRRQEGHRALQKLKNLRIHGSHVKLAWAPGKGVKGKEFKSFWEVDAGVSYIPFDKISNDCDFLDLLEEGGSFDEESLPEHIKVLKKKSELKPAAEQVTQIIPIPVTTAFNPLQAHAPPMVPPPIITPTSVNMPMVMPHLMQHQFGLPIPGLLPPHHQPMVMQVPMGIPPPNPMLMVQQQAPGLLSAQALSLIGGLPAMVPRTLPTIPSNPMQNLKSVAHADPATGSPMIPTAAAGDATPTEEDGTSSPPHSSASVNPSVATTPSQFNALLGHPSAGRPILPGLPPASASGTPIPFPPPQVRFGFPPPGMRPPGNHGVPQGPYGWPPNVPQSENDSSQSKTFPGMPSQNFSNPPKSSDVPTKESKNINDKSFNADSTSNDKAQEMVMSTDDEAHMDDFPPNDMPPFPIMGDFGRGPMNIHQMRGPPGPMMGNRFPHPGMHMFPPQMGGLPRGHDFSPRGQRPPNMRPDHEFREWYPHDFEGPVMERDRREGRHSPSKMDTDPRWEGNRRDDRNFDNNRRGYNDDRRSYNDRRDDRENRRDRRDDRYDRMDDRRDDRRDDRGDRREDRSERREDRGGDRREDRGDRRDGRDDRRDNRDDRRDNRDDRGFSDRRNRHDNAEQPVPGKSSDSENISKPQRQIKNNAMDDLLKLNFYQKGKKPPSMHSFLQKEKKKAEDLRSKESENAQTLTSDVQTCAENKTPDSATVVESNVSKKEKDREAKKRSRWGRTHSEERDFQEQRRNEIEMKIREYQKEAQISGQSLSATDTTISEPIDKELNNIPMDIADIEMQCVVPEENVSDLPTTEGNCSDVPICVNEDKPENPISNCEDNNLFVNIPNVTTLLESISDNFPNLLNNTQSDLDSTSNMHSVPKVDAPQSPQPVSCEELIFSETQTNLLSTANECKVSEDSSNQVTAPLEVSEISNTDVSSLISADS